MKKSIVLIPLPSLIKNSFVRSFVLSLSLGGGGGGGGELISQTSKVSLPRRSHNFC